MKIFSALKKKFPTSFNVKKQSNKIKTKRDWKR